MKLVISCLILSLAGLGSGAAFSWKSFTTAEFQLHNKDSGTEVLASVQVDGNVTEDKVKDFLVKFDSRKDTKFLIHGWLDDDQEAFAINVITAYLTDNDYNVIFVDWASEAKDILYSKSRSAVPQIGRLVAQLVDILVQNYSASLDKIHIVGHSLGAHIAGVAGLNIQSPGKIARITGLDPAHPLFQLTTEERLKPEAANFVDVIHTCSNILSFNEALGHVDFYPNGGKAIQPGCGITDLLAGMCSHGRSHVYFTESIASPRGFLATQCDSYENYTNFSCDGNNEVYMGESVSLSARGSYYLRTNNESPFGLGDEY